MRVSKLRAVLAVTLSILCLLLITRTANAQALKTTVADILSSPDKYDGKIVQVEGTVLTAQFKTSKTGNPCTIFKIGSDENALSVFCFGTLSISVGDSVKVIGRFQKVKHIGQLTFQNEIDASEGNVEKM